MTTLVKKFNIKNILNTGWKKITDNFSNKAGQELNEYEYYTDIKGILADHPDNIKQNIFQGQTRYTIYAGRNKIGESRCDLGMFYIITPEQIGRGGYLYRSNLSAAFTHRVYKEVVEHYNSRFQPKAER